MTFYVWKDDHVVELVTYSPNQMLRDGLDSCPCFDSMYGQRSYKYRSGILEREKGWTYVPVDRFPKEFQMWLLLMELL